MPTMGNYTTGRLLGEGSFGKVWVVKDQRTGKDYALKQLRGFSDGFSQEFLREVSVLTMLNRLNSSHFVNYIESFCHGDTTIIVFELYDCDLSKYIYENPQKMTKERVRDFFKQIVTGVDILHVHNIIHRDLKPQNILIDREMRLRIADFGLARNYSLHATFTTVSVTLWYRAPEILLQCKYSTAIDIWSCACILAEMSNLRALFTADTEIKMARQIFSKLGSMPPNQWPTDAVVEWNNFSGHPPCIWKNILPKLSNPGISLVKSMLSYLPHERPTAAEVLDHEYITIPIP